MRRPRSDTVDSAACGYRWLGAEAVDAAVLAAVTALNVAAAAAAAAALRRRGALRAWSDDAAVNVLWLSLVYAVVNAVPGLLFLAYAALRCRAPRVLAAWTAAVVGGAAAAVLALELRLSVGFVLGR